MKALLKRLAVYCDIGSREEAVAAELETESHSYAPGEQMVCEGDQLRHAFVVERGWASAHRDLEDGRRQVVHFLMPGDFFGLQVMVARTADHSITALTEVEAFRISPGAISHLFAEPSDIGIALWWAQVQEESILREHIVRNGRRNATERVAHLLLELHRRARIVGHAESETKHFPLSQQLIADSLGLSVVHVSRVMTRLTKDKLIERKGKSLKITDRDGLNALCEFDTGYLHLEADISAFRLKRPGRPPDQTPGENRAGAA